MNIFRKLWRKRRRATASKLPVISVTQPLNSYYFLLQVQPLIEYASKEIEVSDPKDILTETVLMAYLMGVGYDYHTSHAIVQAWEAEEYNKNSSPN